jgi:phosphoribosylamine---glycine ligase
MVNVLIVGSGGREHALAWSIARSDRLGKLYIAPGNAGTADLGINVPVMTDDIPALTAFARDNAIDLVVVGPEVPLAAGLVDALDTVGIPAFGPTQAAAQIEASKAFSKAFMQAQGIPTATYAEFDDLQAAIDYVQTVDYQVVVKADGLAAGKGVIVCDTRQQAVTALHDMLEDGAFGGAGETVIVEERLRGPEVSVLAFCDGERVVLMPAIRDHKRAYDGDQGPNTGGMGAFGPVPDVSQDDLKHFEQTILLPAVHGLAERGTPYIGVLYAGLILTANGPRTLEFNCRFGDPETQVILPLLESDLLEIMLTCVQGRLNPADVRWYDGYAATVVAASPGYPQAYPKGLPITGLDAVADSVIFHAGVARLDDGSFQTAGGRVLAVSAVGRTLDSAITQAYTDLGCIHFDGMHYRTDIGRPM